MRDAIRATSSGPPPTSARFAFLYFLVRDGDGDIIGRDDDDASGSKIDVQSISIRIGKCTYASTDTPDKSLTPQAL